MRIVKQADGAIIVDLTGRADGRGAYVCKSAECVEQTAKKKSLNRAFKCNIDPEVYVKIKECLNG
ncbi:MAG: YlxR family protein [Firmicutes bacterium]|nr:YlxR family protein [Bacillota bacterium]